MRAFSFILRGIVRVQALELRRERDALRSDVERLRERLSGSGGREDGARGGGGTETTRLREELAVAWAERDAARNEAEAARAHSERMRADLEGITAKGHTVVRLNASLMAQIKAAARPRQRPAAHAIRLIVHAGSRSSRAALRRGARLPRRSRLTDLGAAALCRGFPPGRQD